MAGLGLAGAVLAGAVLAAAGFFAGVAGAAGFFSGAAASDPGSMTKESSRAVENEKHRRIGWLSCHR